MPMSFKKQIIFALLLRIAHRHAAGELSDEQAKEEAMKLVPNKQERDELLKLLNQELNKRQGNIKPVINCSNKVEMLEAMSHGVSKETYAHNKTLPLEEKLKLPGYELIYALNYKEKVHGKKQ